MGLITAILREDQPGIEGTIQALRANPLIERIVLFTEREPAIKAPDVIPLPTQLPQSGTAWRQVLDLAESKYLLVIPGQREIAIPPQSIERLVEVAVQSQGGLVYADYLLAEADRLMSHPLIDYQLGSIRDNFEFGPLLLYSREAMNRAMQIAGSLTDTSWSAPYELRLKVSQVSSIVHVAEPLCTVMAGPGASKGEKHFDYVDPRNEQYQKELESVATEHLRRTDAWLPPEWPPLPPCETEFVTEASVVIPVRNRERTIADAVRSAADQEAAFPFNILVVDNHSTDRTTNILQKLAGENSRILHLVPDTHALGIGGCWNHAAMSTHAGRYLVQLDSDDIYSGPDTLQRIVDEFGRGSYGMVIGAYRVVDFDLNELPPGVVDHREWTRENGRNNVLRVNGFGAPRAFRTDLIRKHPFPNVSYGEDYAVGLRLSHFYDVGRIYEPLYLCRRWEDNTDAALPLAKTNEYNLYKDRLRSIEIAARRNGVHSTS